MAKKTKRKKVAKRAATKKRSKPQRSPEAQARIDKIAKAVDEGPPDPPSGHDHPPVPELGPMTNGLPQPQTQGPSEAEQIDANLRIREGGRRIEEILNELHLFIGAKLEVIPVGQMGDTIQAKGSFDIGARPVPPGTPLRTADG